MSVVIELVVPKSSSPNLPKVLATARGFEGFSEGENPKHAFTLKVEPAEIRVRHRALEGLYETVRGWRGTQLRINGRVADANSLRSVLDVLKCADGRDAAVLPNEHCSSGTGVGWGCRYLRTIQAGLPQRYWDYSRGSRYWFQFGKFNDGGEAWVIQKAELKEAIVREASATHSSLCPHLDVDEAQRRIDALPDELDLGDDSAWKVVFEDRYAGSTIQQVAVGVMPRQLDESLGFGVSIGVGTVRVGLGEEERANRYIPEVSFGDIGGIDDIIELVREVIELPLKHPAVFKHLGIAPHKGILLYGPPGCGKTLIAKAIANDISAHFISIRGPELISKFVGQSEENLRDVFSEARSRAPSIIFFDEIDAIAQKRSSEETVRHGSVFVTQLLTLMDGMETYENVCVIASTNRLELLDEAIRRPGRFDYVLEVRHPTPSGVLKILQIHTRNVPLGASVNLQAMAAAMNGCTGADIAFVAREAAYNCLRRSTDPVKLLNQVEADVDLTQFTVEQADFERAIDLVRGRVSA